MLIDHSILFDTDLYLYIFIFKNRKLIIHELISWQLIKIEVLMYQRKLDIFVLHKDLLFEYLFIITSIMNLC